MAVEIMKLLNEYTNEIKKTYGEHLKKVILYGSYARGTFTPESDIDIMILVDLDEMTIKNYRHQLSEITFDFNLEHDVDIKPIAKSLQLFQKWLGIYPFYQNINKEGVNLYHAIR